MSRKQRGFVVLAVTAGLMVAASAADAQTRKRDLITREEIDASPQRSEDIYRVIRSLRPHFLEPARGVRRMEIDPGSVDQRTGVRSNARQGQGGSDEGVTAVYMERNHIGGVDVLKGILAEQVAEIRYLDPSAALSEFGVNRGGPAIVLKMFKGLKPDS